MPRHSAATGYQRNAITDFTSGTDKSHGFSIREIRKIRGQKSSGLGHERTMAAASISEEGLAGVRLEKLSINCLTMGCGIWWNGPRFSRERPKDRNLVEWMAHETQKANEG
jgi:hypothetical protein